MIAKLILSIVRLFINLIELLFVARIGLRLLNADSGISLIQLIYQWTDSLLGPVLRIFPSGLNIGYGIDGAAVLGLIFYAVAYFIIRTVFKLLFVAE